MVGPQSLIEKLQTMILEDKQRHEDGLQNWLPILLAILVLSMVPIAVLVFIAMIDRRGEMHLAEKGHSRTSKIWEGIRETEPSEPEQKISEMGKQISLAFDSPFAYVSAGQKAFELENLMEEAIDPAPKNAEMVRKRKLSMVEV